MQNQEEIGKVKRKFLEFKKIGLESYQDYLKEQLKNSEGNEMKGSYVAYLKNQMEDTDEKIAAIDSKLNQF